MGADFCLSQECLISGECRLWGSMNNRGSNYSGLEKCFDDMTPEWIVPVGRVLRELEVDGKDTGNLKWGFRVKFNGRVVHKATPVAVNGGNNH